ncbi:MAG: hypothetical protein LBF74_03710 [Treponema sp.]|jgi:hypothetical protein|nr:hypothetical protein [Treponema sp.]
MKKAELKGRVFHAGIIAAVIVVLTGLGACDGFVLDDLAKQDAAVEQSGVNANGLVAVKVALPGGSGRSVSADLVQAYIEYYEVIFKEHGGSKYFIGTAVDGKEYLSVEVEPKLSYDVLLLAGTEANRVLLATGFVNNADGDGYDPSGDGYTVTVDAANVITFTMRKTNILVGTELVADTDSTDVTYSRDEAATGDKIATFLRPRDSSDDLVVEFDGSTKLQDLENAGGPSGILFVANTLTLKPLYPKYPLAVKTVTPSIQTGVEFTYIITDADLPGDDEDIDGKLIWELAYYAFGTPDSKSTRWNIRNGLDYGIDQNDSGGSIRVKFGDGSKNYPTVPVNTGF